MAFRGQSTTWFAAQRLVSVLACFFAFALFLVPQLSASCCERSAETECPCEQDGERSESEVVATSLIRHRLDCRRSACRDQIHRTGNHVTHRLTSYVCRPPAIVGHQLANDLDAPLLI